MAKDNGVNDRFTDTVDTEKFGPRSQAMFDFLTQLVIGQDRAARLVVRSLAARAVGLNDPERPEVVVCPGPSGSGKTYTAEVVARFLIEDNETNPPFTKFDCAELTEHHQLSELRGSPPGYVGYGEIPRGSQLKIDEPAVFAKLRTFIREHPDVDQKLISDPNFLANFYRKNGPYQSVVVFDEFEKGCRQLHNLLYNVLDKGTMTMARGGEVTSFRNSVIFLTMNVGDGDIFDLLSRQSRQLGFGRKPEEAKRQVDVTQQIYEMTMKKMKEVFQGPLIGRMAGRIVVFRPLSRDDLGRIADLMISQVMKRLRESRNEVARQVRVQFAPEFKEFLLDEGTSPEFGARELRKAVERHVAYKLANAIENGEARAGDELLFTVDTVDGKPDTVLRRAARPKHYLIGVPAVMAGAHEAPTTAIVKVNGTPVADDESDGKLPEDEDK